MSVESPSVDEPRLFRITTPDDVEVVVQATTYESACVALIEFFLENWGWSYDEEDLELGGWID